MRFVIASIVLFVILLCVHSVPTSGVVRQITAIPGTEGDTSTTTDTNTTAPGDGVTPPENGDAGTTVPSDATNETTATNATETTGDTGAVAPIPITGPTNATNATTATPVTPVTVAPVSAGEEGTAWGFVSRGAGAEDDDLTDYDVFARAVTQTGYAGVMTTGGGGDGLTIFLPNDEAFKNTLSLLGYTGSDSTLFDALGRVFGNQTSTTTLNSLYNIIGYHVIPGGNSDSMLRRKPLITFAGKMIAVQEDGSVQDVASASNLTAAKIVGDPTGTAVDNAIVYQVDRVLFPFVVDVEKARAVINTNATASAQDDNCFPASAQVRLADGQIRQISQLSIGDIVVVDDNGTTSKVYAFTHRQHRGIYPFVRIHAGSSVLTLSHAHYVYGNGVTKRADEVRPGDALLSIDGNFMIVQHTQRVFKTGLFAPHTLHGDIVVDGIIVSTYTKLFPRDAAHALLAPIRAVSRVGLSHEPLGSLFYNGLSVASWPSNAFRSFVLHAFHGKLGSS